MFNPMMSGPLYESVLAKMKRDAVIEDCLPIFAARQVKEISAAEARRTGRNISNKELCLLLWIRLTR
jgi:hypothetical protein